ncbi:MAG: carboxymuconolactone decarboxylase family protein, partial [Alphaproteobacteria bacterium]
MSDKLPGRAGRFAEQNPAIWQAYQDLGKACYEAGPLDARTRRLVKLAIAVGMGAEGAVHSQVRRGLGEAMTADEARHVAHLAIPSVGFAKAIAAL